jgi:hypothetical protein
MDRPPRLILVTLVVVAVVSASCGGEDLPTVETPQTGETPPMEPVRSGAPSANAGQMPAELEATDQPLRPGTYTRSGFEPALTIELDEGWRAIQLFDGFFDVQRDETIGTPDVIAVQFARPTGVFGADGITEPADAAEAAELLAANLAFGTVESSASRIGGMAGHQVTVENAGTAHAQVLVVPPGPLGIDPGRRLWVAFFDTHDGLLAIMVGGSAGEWHAALDAAEPVLESLELWTPTSD